MDTAKQPPSMGTKRTPTQISKLALEFLTLCEEDSGLMTTVYRAALALVGAVPEGTAPQKSTAEESGKTTASSQGTALTPDEARAAKEEFRLRNGLSKLTPQQAKMAKAIWRERKEKGTLQSSQSPRPAEARQLEPASSQKKKEKVSAPNPTQRLSPKGDRPQLGEGSRATWNVKLKQQRQRALERAVTMQDNPKDVFASADYFNARLTLEDTWIRFQGTYDCSGKRDPLQDLPPLPNSEEIVKGMKENGVQARQHTTGHFILQDESTGASLRPKI